MAADATSGRRGSLLALVVVALLLGAAPAGASTVSQDGYLTVSDGTRLRWHLDRPAGDGPLPVMVQYDGYSAGTHPDYGAIPMLRDGLLAKGYALLGVSIRGTGCSAGTMDFLEPREARDGAEVIDWASRQPWSDGRVGMFGYSYAGITQLLTAGLRPPALRAIVPSSPLYDLYRDVGWPGGIPNSAFAALFTVQQKQPGLATAVPDAIAGGDAECAVNFAHSQLASPLIVEQAANSPYIDGPIDPEARSPAATAARIDVPVLLNDVWQDEQTGSRLGGILPGEGGLLDALDPARTWITFENGNHEYNRTNLVQVALQERFIDHYVKGAHNGWQDEPHVRVLDDVRRSTGAASWITTSRTMPRPAAVALSLAAGHRLALDPPRAPAGAPGTADSYAYPRASASTDPLVWAHLGLERLWGAVGPADGRVVFTTPPLDADVVTFGSASTDLWITSTATDTDLQATITDVRPDGGENFVQRGWLRASARALDAQHSTPTRPQIDGRASAARPLVSGEPTLVRLEIRPFSHVFRRGSAIRLIVDAPTGITGDWGFDYIKTPATDTVLHDADHPSRLVLGVLPGDTARAPAPPCDDLLNMPCRTTIATVPTGTIGLAAAALRAAAAARASARLSLAATLRRQRTGALRVHVSGRLAVASGKGTEACTGTVATRIRDRAGRLLRRRLIALDERCRYARSITLAPRRAGAVVSAHFAGNDAIRPGSARSVVLGASMGKRVAMSRTSS